MKINTSQFRKRKGNNETGSNEEESPKRQRRSLSESVADNEINSFDKEIKYLEEKLGLNSNDSKAKKEVRRRLNKELKEDGFGDDILSFLDEIDNVMDMDHLEDAKKMLSAEELAALENQADKPKAKSQKRAKGKEEAVPVKKGSLNLSQLEKEAERIPDDIADDDGVEDDFSDEIVDSSYLRSFASKNGFKVLNGDGEESQEGVSDEDQALLEDDADLLKSEDSLENEEESEREEVSEREVESEEEEESEMEESTMNDTETKEAEKEESKDVSYGSITDIYGRVLKGKENALKQFTSKYVPPHLRGAAKQEEKPEVEEAMLKAVREVVNKVTDDTFVAMCNSLIAIYAKYPKNSVRQALFDTIVAASRNAFKVIPHFVRLYAGMVAAVQHESDLNAVSFFVENVVLLVEEEYKKAVEEHDRATDSMVEYSKTPINLMLLLAFFYYDGLITSTLLSNLLTEGASHFTELDVECIFVIMKIVGFKLRGDAPGELKDLILTIKEKADMEPWKSNQRVQLMLETVYSIKNNRDNTETKQERDKATKTRNLISKTFGSAASPLSISLQDIRNIETNGRWWVLGAQYKPVKQAEEVKAKKNSMGRVLATADPKVLRIAEKLHMNTDVRKAVFVVLVTGSDYMETFDRLLQLNLQSVQEREIIRIILVCAAREKRYNPYYCLLLTQLCHSKPAHRFTLQLSYQDVFKSIEDYSEEKLKNLAILLSNIQYLIQKFVLSLSILRIVDFGKHDKKTTYFLEVMIVDFLENANDQVLPACISRVGSGADFITVRDGLMVFLKSHMKPLVEDKPALKSQMRKMTKYLDRLGMNEDVDE